MLKIEDVKFRKFRPQLFMKINGLFGSLKREGEGE